MGAADRTVQRLHLRAPSAQAAVRAVHRLEDALRCASLPDVGERVLLVRRLHLGRLPEGLSSQSLSLLIEQRVAAIGGEWVQGGEARAAQADTVFFASHLQAAQTALRRRAQGVALSAWYWPLALPEVVVQAAPAAFLEQLVEGLCSHASAPATLPAWVADAVAGGHADWLVRHLPASAVHRLLGASAVQGAPASAAPAVQPTDWVMPSGLTVRLPAHSPRWVHAVLGAAQWRPAAARGLAGTAAWSEAVNPLPINGPTQPMAGTSASPVSEPTAVLATHRPVADAAAYPSSHRAVGRSGSTAEIGTGEATQLSIKDPLVASDAAAWAALPTRCGGLLFVLPVLQRLGFAEWQAAHPDVPLCVAVLQQLLHRLALPPDDPAWALVTSLPVPVPVPVDGAPAPAVEHWVKAVRSHLRRQARIGLASLCLRPAHLSWSPSHLDVHFALASADLRVRRLGLDVDPGWLPWLQRVVAFHFVREAEGP